MSLLNNVLQDLNKRKSSPENNYENATIISHFDEKKHSRRNRKKHSFYLIYLLLLLALVVFLIVWVPRFKWVRSEMSVSPMSFSASAEKNEKVFGASKYSGTSAALNNIVVAHHETITTVTMTLDKSIQYELETSKDHQTLTLILPNTQLKNSPLLPITDPIVKSVEQKETPDGVELIFQVIPDTEMHSLDLKEGQPVTLVMQLNNQTIPLKEEKIEQIKTPISPVDQDYQHALELITQNHLDQGIDALIQILVKKPNFLEARTSLAIALLNQQRFDEVAQVLQDGLNQNAAYIPFVELQARLLLSLGQTKDALAALKKHSPSIDGYPNYYALMAAIYQRLGDGDKAAGLYGQLLEVDNANGAWWFGLGVAFESINNPNAAIDAYKHATLAGKLNPNLQSYALERIRQLGG